PLLINLLLFRLAILISEITCSLYLGGCAKNKEDCGSCIPGAAPEEHVGFQHAFRCEMIHESAPIDCGLIPQWLA
ncbi:Uncharacterized protein APZ42_007311, partial [Daphnia magna]